MNSPVYQRETGMTAYEIMLSESQERMLLVAEKGREAEVFRVFEKWGLDAAEIGRVTNDGKMRVLEHGVVVSEIPNHALTDDAPVYRRPLKRWEPPLLREMPEGIRLPTSGDLTQARSDCLPPRIFAASAGCGSNTIIPSRPTRLKRRARAMPA